jgi:hypothetical protein
MAWTAATSQTLVETARQKFLAAAQALEAYIQVNNPGKLATANAAVDAAEAAAVALQA